MTQQELVDTLEYRYSLKEEIYPLPYPLKVSLEIILNFFSTNSNNKLCLVFPTKEYVSQWLSLPLTISLLQSDFAKNKNEIFENYRHYKPKDKLLLNGQAVVEWAGVKEKGVSFKTKGVGDSSGAEITIAFSDVVKLQSVGTSRKLSSLKRVKEALPKKKLTPIDRLLNLETYGNKEFNKTKICLVCKINSYRETIDNILLNNCPVTQYYQFAKIDENGEVLDNCPLVLTNNLCNLSLYLAHSSKSFSKIIIDSIAPIQQRITDFNSIDALGIPTILITDLSEAENFTFINNYGFDFFTFSKETLDFENSSENSPFSTFNEKLKKYTSFNLVKELCKDSNLETVTQKIYSIEKDDSNQDLNNVKIHLIQLTNLISRVCYIPTADEIKSLTQKLNSIEMLFNRSRMWLGDSHVSIAECIIVLKLAIVNLSLEPSNKYLSLIALLSKNTYDYIICPTEQVTHALKSSLTYRSQTQIISVADVKDTLLTSKYVKAILTGWPKSGSMNRLLSSFIFSELTTLFYQFENTYCTSLISKNRKYNDAIRSTINKQGFCSRTNSENSKGFGHLYLSEEASLTIHESSFDILEFELKFDNAQYSKYKTSGKFVESIKAKRLDFENDIFFYSSESHKFLVINELVQSGKGLLGNVTRKKIESLSPGDVIAQINTTRDILADLVETNTNEQDFAAVKQWTDLWKNLLKEHFSSVSYSFKELVDELRKHGCKKHEVTIRSWLQDENRIGPDDDSDLISIALMTNSKRLYDNISQVREAIRKMTGWRMKASDFISDKIKAQIHDFTDSSTVNNKISIEGLGSVIVLKVVELSNVWENIDVRYVNRLLQKEIT